jgi:hypothetical protein
MKPVPIPWDCADGFFHAYCRRPSAYLQSEVRRAASVWARVGPVAEQRAVSALRADLASGRWIERSCHNRPGGNRSRFTNYLVKWPALWESAVHLTDLRAAAHARVSR